MSINRMKLHGQKYGAVATAPVVFECDYWFLKCSSETGLKQG